MEKSRIEWTDYTWNPVTGCKHGCTYCYAERMSKRFCGDIRHNKVVADYSEHDGIYEIENEVVGRNGRSVIYPFGFVPTLHKNRLTKNCKPRMIKRSSTIFVCSTADLFGEWVPDDWIKQVFEICVENPQHRYLFLTKNQKRYIQLRDKGMLPDSNNMWYGTTVTRPNEEFFYSRSGIYNTYISIEPILEPFTKYRDMTTTDWVIVGAETGNRKGKVVPDKKWISDIVDTCSFSETPVFLKNNLASIWNSTLIQEFPWSDDK